MEKISGTRNRKCKRIIVLASLAFFLVVLGIVVGMDIKSASEQQAILTESIEAQLLSISVAAREIIDVDAFELFNSAGDMTRNQGTYGRTLTRLRLLANNVGADYIYALKYINGQYYFIYDTDMEDTGLFQPYELSPVHEEAFAGKETAGVMNVQDEYGSFNTGAVPIWKDGKVIGIIATDIRDTLLEKSEQTTRRNAIILIATLVITLGVMFFLVIRLLDRVQKMQERLRHLAHYDTVTGLPNRQYLLESLGAMTNSENAGAPFALLFIDLDNFKKVNDNAGHEAGDDLLRHIANYINTSTTNARAFRPTAGQLNLSARIGGDEFVQVVSGVSTREEAAAVAQKLLDGFATKEIDRFIDKYAVGLSIGVALYPYHSKNFHVLIKYADVAMYHAKKAGKNQYRVYDDEMAKTEIPENR